MSHYETLGVPAHADADAIRAAFRANAWAAHPDHGGDAERMTAVNRAYEVLSDPELRAQYDRTGDDRRMPPVDYLARDAVMNAVLQTIEQDGDLVQMMVAGFQARQQEIHDELAKMPGRIERMKARAAKVRVKNGQANLVQMVVEQRTAEMAKRREQLDQALLVIARALEFVADHEWLEQQVYSVFISGTATSSTTGGFR